GIDRREARPALAEDRDPNAATISAMKHGRLRIRNVAWNRQKGCLLHLNTIEHGLRPARACDGKSRLTMKALRNHALHHLKIEGASPWLPRGCPQFVENGSKL